MKLRSGRVFKLHTAVPNLKLKRKVILELRERLRMMKVAIKEAEESTLSVEVKAFFRFLFYHVFKQLGNKERIQALEIKHARRATLDELINWEADDHFWQSTFKKTEYRMRSEVPLSRLLQVFPFFMASEYGIQQGSAQYFGMKMVVKSYLEELITQNNSKEMMKIRDEEAKIQETARKTRNKNLYLNYLATDLASKFTNPFLTSPWETMLNRCKERYCFIPDVEGGITVVKIPVAYFSLPPLFEFLIAETGEKFTSPEKNMRKALLLHKRIAFQKLSCVQEFLKEKNDEM